MSSRLVVLVRMGIVLCCLVVMPIAALPPVRLLIRWPWRETQVAEVHVQPQPAFALQADEENWVEQGDLARPVGWAAGKLPSNEVMEAAWRDPEEVDAQLVSALQAMGASELSLKKNEEDRYLFRCHLPLPGTEVYSREFLAEKSDPREAIEEVHTAVEFWQHGIRTAQTQAAIPLH